MLDVHIGDDGTVNISHDLPGEMANLKVIEVAIMLLESVRTEQDPQRRAVLFRGVYQLLGRIDPLPSPPYPVPNPKIDRHG